MGAGKWIGGIIGFMAGGPLGALAGYALGSLIELVAILQVIRQTMATGRLRKMSLPGNGTVFFFRCW